MITDALLRAPSKPASLLKYASAFKPSGSPAQAIETAILLVNVFSRSPDRFGVRPLIHFG